MQRNIVRCHFCTPEDNNVYTYITEMSTFIVYVLFQGLELFQAYFHDSPTTLSKSRSVIQLLVDYGSISCT